MQDGADDDVLNELFPKASKEMMSTYGDGYRSIYPGQRVSAPRLTLITQVDVRGSSTLTTDIYGFHHEPSCIPLELVLAAEYIFL
ncbi:hypothetical protein EG328_000647 [Venturia inaequalis]|uniref:Uncharacterized protein n=1 Tax=Venturia inaequalis TaxID=5025 RepID=A0A8H3V012_VENIN|nr:hypothetical protein EG327_010244 [Venturia inaequalis]KAE9979889.1 hypothetical protein EG328_000647 [Venturia inaequalis]